MLCLTLKTFIDRQYLLTVDTAVGSVLVVMMVLTMMSSGL